MKANDSKKTSYSRSEILSYLLKFLIREAQTQYFHYIELKSLDLKTIKVSQQGKKAVEFQQYLL